MSHIIQSLVGEQIGSLHSQSAAYSTRGLRKKTNRVWAKQRELIQQCYQKMAIVLKLSKYTWIHYEIHIFFYICIPFKYKASASVQSLILSFSFWGINTLWQAWTCKHSWSTQSSCTPASLEAFQTQLQHNEEHILIHYNKLTLQCSRIAEISNVKSSASHAQA